MNEENRRIKSIQDAIREKGARWTAGKTPVSGLSFEEQKRRCGLLIRPILEELRVRPAVFVALPEQFDWRDKDEKDWTTTIKDQGACGSCWDFGSLAALESQFNIQTDTPDINRDLSEQFLLSCSGGSCNGWYIDTTLNWLKTLWKPKDKNTGTPDEDCFPYEADDSIPCDNVCSDYADRLYHIKSWDWVEDNVESIKNFVYVAPVPAGMKVYQDFISYTSGVYEHVSGSFLGYHLVAIVGWGVEEGEEDEEEIPYWICKNSWGTGWGESGWFKIKCGECSIESMVAQYDAVGRRFGDIECITDPSGANIEVEGKTIDDKETPYTIEGITPYTHIITFEYEDYTPCSIPVPVTAGKITTISCDLEPTDCSCDLLPKMTKEEFINTINEVGGGNAIDLSKVDPCEKFNQWCYNDPNDFIMWRGKKDSELKKAIFIDSINTDNPPTLVSNIRFYHSGTTQVDELDADWLTARIIELPFFTPPPPDKHIFTVTYMSILSGFGFGMFMLETISR